MNKSQKIYERDEVAQRIESNIQETIVLVRDQSLGIDVKKKRTALTNLKNEYATLDADKSRLDNEIKNA